MMARIRKPTREQQAIEALSGWAVKNRFMEDPYVRNLLSALVKRTNLPFWASKDPAEYLPHPAPESSSRLAKVNSYLIIVRNVVVFVPVALTWSAVSHATNAFGIYTSNNPNSVANFLQFWQNGYDVLAPEWRIGFVANLDFLLIALVIALTLYTSVLHSREEKRIQAATNFLESERLQVALLISEYLFEKQKVTTVTVNAGINGSVQNLKNATQKLSDVVKKIDKKIQS